MTPLPKRKLSTRRQARREQSIKLKIKKAVRCSNCRELTLSHRVCKKCGFYDGKKIIKIKIKKNKKKE